jgi:hypothetical protein
MAAPQTQVSPKAAARPGIDDWLQANFTGVALAITGAGLLIKVLVALPTFLNSDEVSNAFTALQPTLGGLFTEAFKSPHPPLYFLVLRLWSVLGASDFMLRLPSVLAGTAAIWVAFRWLALIFDRNSALVALIILTFSPAVTAQLVEVRQYSFLYLVAAAGLLWLERAFILKSARHMLLSGLMFALAVYTHSSAFWLVIAVGAYGVVRLSVERPPRKVAGAWALSQAVIAGLCALVYFTQLAHHRGGFTETYARENWLRTSYFHAGSDNVLWFPIRQTSVLFQYLYSLPIDGVIMMLGSLAAVVYLLVKGRPHAGSESARRDLGLLLILPFAVTCAAALAGVYPYGGSRHSILLALFAAAGAGFIIARFANRRIWPILLGAAVLVPIWVSKAVPPEGQPSPTGQRRELVTNAIDYIRQDVPPGRIIFTDILNQFTLRRYLDRKVTPELPTPAGQLMEYDVAGYRLVASLRYFNFPPDSFGDEFARMAAAYGLGPGDTVCVASMGWGSSVAWRLYNRYGMEYEGTRVFSPSIAVMEIPVGEEPSAANFAARNEKADRALRGLARAVRANPPERFRAVFWPTDLLADSTRALARALSDNVMSYEEMYDAVRQGTPFADLLPALAFWQFRTPEIHNEFMSYMEDAENYISGGYRFTLKLVSADSAAAAYVIEPTRIESGPSAVIQR